MFDVHDEDEILRAIGRLGASYPSELSRIVLFDLDKVFRMVNKLKDDGMIERLRLDEYNPSPLIKCRMQDLWARGIKGFYMFSSMSFYILTKKGIDKLKTKNLFKNKVTINSAYVTAGIAFIDQNFIDEDGKEVEETIHREYSRIFKDDKKD